MVCVLSRLVLFVISELAADRNWFFYSSITLTSHSSFVSGELGCHEADTVNWDFSTVLKKNHITHCDEVVMLFMDFSVSEYIDLKMRLVKK